MTTIDLGLALRAEALFASTLQESDRPSARRVREAVADAVRRMHADGLAAILAQEAGDHPDLYRRRMRWALRTVAEAYGSGPAYVRGAGIAA
jgi:hypothetical protein